MKTKYVCAVYSTVALVLLSLWPLVSQATAAEATRPNVIYIMADDMGTGDVECFGRDRCQVETPGFDRLASEGMMFTDAHAVASFCVPSRIAIMTGRYPWRFRRPSPDGQMGYLTPRLATDQFTLGVLLNRVGYHTAYIGKWHLGTRMQTTDGKSQGPNNVDYTKPVTVGPSDYGFDDSFILPASLDMFPYAYIRNNQWVGTVNQQRGWSAFNRVGPAAEGFEDHKVLNDLSVEMEHFIARSAQQAARGKPFFLYFALTAPHTPISPSRSKAKAKSVSMVTSLWKRTIALRESSLHWITTGSARTPW